MVDDAGVAAAGGEGGVVPGQGAHACRVAPQAADLLVARYVPDLQVPQRSAFCLLPDS